MPALTFSGWLSRPHALPQEVLRFVGAANLLSAVVCLGLAVRYWERVSGFGIAHLVGEAVIVGGLAALERGQRHRLAGTSRQDDGRSM